MVDTWSSVEAGLNRHSLSRSCLLAACLLALTAPQLNAQRAPRPVLEGDRVRLSSPAPASGRVEGYVDRTWFDSLRLFSDSALLPRTIRWSGISFIQAERRVRSSRSTRAWNGFLLGWLGTVLVGSIACRGDGACAEGAGYLSVLIAPVFAVVAAVPSEKEWLTVEASSGDTDANRGSNPTCDATDRARAVTVPAGTAINVTFTEGVSDTLRRPATLLLRADNAIVVDGHTVVEQGALVRAPVSAAEGPSYWNNPGTLRLLVASVPTSGGQDLTIGTIHTREGRRNGTLTALFAGWMPGGHAAVPAGSRITGYTSVAQVVCMR